RPQVDRAAPPRHALERGAECARCLLGGVAWRAIRAPHFDGTAQPSVLRGRGRARDAVGHRRRRLGIGRAGSRGGGKAVRRPAMSRRPKALIAWSSGKDSAWALYEARRAGDCEIVGALTTVTETFGRVSMHGVREELLMAQLASAGLAPTIVPIPFPCPNEVY